MLKSYTSQQSTKTEITYSRMNTNISQGNNKQNYQHINQNISENIISINETIQTLKQYQKLCIEKEQFLSAEETKQKIQFLLLQSKTIEKQRDVLKEQKNVQNICKQGEEQVQKFQQLWDQMIQNLVMELKQIQINAIKQQEIQMNSYKNKIQQQQAAKIKYSAKVLELRKNLTSLIRVRKYKEAQQIKNKLRELQLECEEKWHIKFIEKQKLQIQKVEKRQMGELSILRKKLKGIFQEKIKQRDEKFQILLKRNRKRRIQSSKSKVMRAGQSMTMKSRSQSRVLQDSKFSNYTNSIKG